MAAYHFGMNSDQASRPKAKEPTNRIREIRESKGLVAEELAVLTNTTEATISRLETGERKLTEDWMRRIAKALGVEPADLLESATFVNFEDDVEPYIGDVAPSVLVAIKASDLLLLRIKGSQLEKLDIGPGFEAPFRTSEDAIRGAKTGDVVLAQLRRRSDGKTCRIVRQFIAPGMLVTNRIGRNITINLDEPRYDVDILGVLVHADLT